jgi:hypothetical protein
MQIYETHVLGMKTCSVSIIGYAGQRLYHLGLRKILDRVIDTKNYRTKCNTMLLFYENTASKRLQFGRIPSRII